MDLGYASGVRIFRTSCFGNQDNDWMLLVPSEFAVCLYREIMMAGRKLGAKNVGRSAVDCLRIERAVPQFGKELTSFISPKESGLMHWVQLGKKQDFFRETSTSRRQIFSIKRRSWYL
ncbi:pyruvate dehydrogenase phosphatase regulatory subunit, mitochondrial-like [Montipora capricornis]|uniref:pyruvate dehydrogenase phosphatase regulatory subunit, mitochondrial-like n=1 Tax=Montipora capricornis TaxID=246305 RepID=UPI0035F185DD